MISLYITQLLTAWRAVCVKTIFRPKPRAKIRFRGHDSFSRRRYSFRGDESFSRRRISSLTIRFSGDDFFIKRRNILKSTIVTAKNFGFRATSSYAAQ